MASIMAPFPRFFFAYLEPIMCFSGLASLLADPNNITSIFDSTSSRPPTGLESLWALQWGTLAFLLGLHHIVVMWFSTEPKVIRGFVWASAATEIPRQISYAIARQQEGLAMFDLQSWPTMYKMQVITPLITVAIKLAYLAGVLGKDRAVKRRKD